MKTAKTRVPKLSNIQSFYKDTGKREISRACIAIYGTILYFPLQEGNRKSSSVAQLVWSGERASVSGLGACKQNEQTSKDTRVSSE